MSYVLLIKKIRLEKGNLILASTLRAYCTILKLDYYAAIGYLLRNRYVIRILRGIFYRSGIEERITTAVPTDFYGILANALALKGVRNWYIGLESALPLNNLTHEYVAVDYIINDALFRAKPFDILGKSVKFTKTSAKFFSFGIIPESVPHSDVEKTILDLIYFGKYNNKTDSAIKNEIAEYIDRCDPVKLKRYAEHYPKTVRALVEVV